MEDTKLEVPETVIEEKLLPLNKIRVVDEEGRVLREEEVIYNSMRLKFMKKTELKKRVNFFRFAKIDFSELDIDQTEVKKDEKKANKSMLKAAKEIDMVGYQSEIDEVNVELLRITFALNVKVDDIHIDDMETMIKFISQQDLLKVNGDIEEAKKKTQEISQLP